MVQSTSSPESLNCAAGWRYLVVAVLLTAGSCALSLVPVPAISFPAAFVFLVVLPGMQVVRWLGLYASWREARTLILSVASGLLMVPIAVHWASLVFGFSRPVVFAALVAVILTGATINALKPTKNRPPAPLCETRRQYVFLSILLVVLIAGILLPYVELYTPAGVYPVEMGDWFKHYGVAWSIRNTGVPPVDVFFYGDPSRERLSYYYFFHLNVAVLDLVHGGESSVYWASVLAVLAVAVSFVMVFYLFARRVWMKIGAALWSLFCVVLVGGLDVIPMIPRNLELFRKVHQGAPLSPLAYVPADHVDNWAPAPYLRLNTLYATYIWVPQHVAGLLAFFLGLYFFKEVTHSRRLVLMAPFMLLTLLGHSVWIALIAFACLSVYAVLDVRARWRAEGRSAALRVFSAYVSIGLIFLVISVPLLREYVSPAAPKSGIAFEIPLTRDWPWLSPFKTCFSDAWWSRLLDVLLHYVWELGALLICGVAGLCLFRARQRQEPLMPFFYAALFFGFVTATFFASGRAWTSQGFTLNNDLGMRAIMPAQATLALFAGLFLHNRKFPSLANWRRRWLEVFVFITLALGVAAFGWEVCAMGIAKYLNPPRIDAATYRAFQAMRTVTEPLSVVKHRTHDNASSYQLMFGDRSPGFFTVEAAVFHPDLREVARQFGLSRFAYLNRLPAWSYQMFRQMHADYVYVGAIDRTADLSPEKFDNLTYYERVYSEDPIAIYKVRDLPLDHVQARFAPAGIQYMGHIIDQSPVYPTGFQAASTQALVTAWQLEQPVQQDFTVYVHFLAPDGRVVAQADHELWTWADQSEGPTSRWESGQLYLDMVPLPAEVVRSTIPLRIGIGVWMPATATYQQGETTSLSFDENHRVVIGTVEPSKSGASEMVDVTSDH